MIEINRMDWLDTFQISWADVAPLLAVMGASMVAGILLYMNYLKLNRCFVVQLPKE